MKVGILGAGQLSRMLALAGIPLGVSFSFYDPAPTECVKDLGKQFQAAYSDFDTLKEFLAQVDVVTYENENIPLPTLEFILAENISLAPCIDAIKAMQDRLFEKQFLQRLSIPTVEYTEVKNLQELKALVQRFSFPFVMKQRRNSYDGKGQIVVKSEDDFNGLTDVDFANYIVEKFVNFEREVSIVGCRDKMGNIAFYDVAHNIHVNGILRLSKNLLDDSIQGKAQRYLTKIMDDLQYVGVCTAEFFQIGDELVVNELAPRVHNSGHWTIEGAQMSQFENHLRCILDYPVGDTTSLGRYTMCNILGTFPLAKTILQYPTVHLHDYDKAEKPNRKIGHVTYQSDKALDEVMIKACAKIDGLI